MCSYDSQRVLEFGSHEFFRLYKELKAIDSIHAKIAKWIKQKSESYTRPGKNRIRQKLRRLRKAYFRRVYRVQNMRSDMHKKVALYLVRHYDHIILPTFDTQSMVGNLSSKVSRAMLTWSHYQFKQYLTFKCQQYNKKLYIVSEAFTSQICGRCQSLNKTTAEMYKCASCGLKMDRDAMASRNIFIKHSCRQRPFNVDCRTTGA
jgi:putative transposase